MKTPYHIPLPKSLNPLIQLRDSTTSQKSTTRGNNHNRTISILTPISSYIRPPSNFMPMSVISLHLIRFLSHPPSSKDSCILDGQQDFTGNTAVNAFYLDVSVIVITTTLCFDSDSNICKIRTLGRPADLDGRTVTICMAVARVPGVIRQSHSVCTSYADNRRVSRSKLPPSAFLRSFRAGCSWLW
ncbi:uncharacterized protein ASPGLDRAFT_1052459 [Aspergillus glaucus CBS 516.65]|uniref:Uncharacterized protein n=1 Tax=Aspergillus glaucus CBS 516.65 TaxID=1160497 RepID=A0A1L9V683_ASPGL|nr:hypothetical protein ASPGLDRAFT_1052459 [Aspergillus glaucus CBS 516.65]OJJ79433.1 hypothetical protein ASPGLDRAFT_1052459 [Aspergillus glaucus CBS 516.65]